jgi:hypothetical protein
VTIDKYAPECPVRVEYAGSCLHYSRIEAHDLYEQLGGILMELDPPDTIPPPADTEPGTLPETPVAIRRSSGNLQAVTSEAADAFRAAREMLAK